MRAHLIDLSKWNQGFDPGKINAQNGAVVDGIILRASYGLMPDRQFQNLTQAAQPIPVRASYHYFSSAVPWQTQAELFLRQVKGRGFHFYKLDFEKAYNKKSAGFALGAKKWIAYMAAATGQKVGLYTNPSTYDEWLMPYGNWMADWPLWIAQWPYPGWKEELTRVRTDNSLSPWLPKGRRDWTFWQYSADGNHRGADFGVKSRDVDLNVFNGTVAELYAWAGVELEIPTEPAPEPPPIPIPEPPPPTPEPTEPPADEDTIPVPVPPPNPKPEPSGPPTSLIELLFKWLVRVLKAFEDWRRK